MKRSIAAVIALGTSLAGTGAALAGGMTTPVLEPEPMVPVAPVVSTGGDWTGGYVGAQLGYGDIAAPGTALDGTGAIGGLHAGYRFDYGQIVAGAEVNYDKANIDLGTPGAKLDDVARLKLMAGYDMGNTLLYVSGGAARASATVGGASLKDNGYFLGLGGEYALSDQWSLGGEVNGHHFSNFGGTGTDIDATTVQARVSFRF